MFEEVVEEERKIQRNKAKKFADELKLYDILYEEFEIIQSNNHVYNSFSEFCLERINRTLDL